MQLRKYERSERFRIMYRINRGFDLVARKHTVALIDGMESFLNQRILRTKGVSWIGFNFTGNIVRDIVKWWKAG